MIKALLSVFISAAVSLSALSAPKDENSPEFRAYTSFSFGAPQGHSLGLHYGLRMDNDSRISQVNSFDKAAVVQVDFSQKSGFESAHLYGIPLTTPSLMLNEAGDPSVTTKLLWFGGLFILGGATYGIHEWAHSGGSDPAPAPPLRKCCFTDFGLNVSCCN